MKNIDKTTGSGTISKILKVIRTIFSVLFVIIGVGILFVTVESPGLSTLIISVVFTYMGLVLLFLKTENRKRKQVVFWIAGIIYFVISVFLVVKTIGSKVNANIVPGESAGIGVYLENISGLFTSILSFKGLATLFVLFFIVTIAVFFFQSFYKTSLLVTSASGGTKKLSGPAVFSSLCEAFGKIVHNIVVLLPIFAGIIVVLIAVTGILKITVGINQFIEREKRIKELTIAIKYLEQSEKVLDVRVLSVRDGVSTLRLRYDAQGDPNTGIPNTEWRDDITIQGTDIYFDCMVLNFTHSEITSGRQKNIAIPYRVYSSVIPAENAVSLNLVGDILSEDDFGFIPPIYKERLIQLFTDQEFAKDMGVRSVNGSAVHRYVFEGDRYKIKVDNTGGIHLE